jgi:cbb3-type cytochrome oxidase subunit 3
MKLSDIMGHMDLAGYAEIGLGLFLAVFLAQAAWLFLPSTKRQWKSEAELPLHDEEGGR